MEPVAFTLRNDKLLPCLITPCKVSQAYDSSSNTPRPISIEVKGLWDTGASCTVITKEAANKLGIQPITQSITYHAQGESLVNIYFINVILPNGIDIMGIKASEGKLSGFDILIGMDVINCGDFSITHRNNGTVFSFQIPSTHEYDFVKQIDNSKTLSKPKQKKKR